MANIEISDIYTSSYTGEQIDRAISVGRFNNLKGGDEKAEISNSVQNAVLAVNIVSDTNSTDYTASSPNYISLNNYPTLSGTNTFSGDNTFSGTNRFSGEIKATKTLTVTGDIAVTKGSNKTSINGEQISTTNITATGAVKANSLTVTESITGNLTVAGDTTFENGVNFNGAITAAGAAIFNNEVQVNGNSFMVGDTINDEIAALSIKQPPMSGMSMAIMNKPQGSIGDGYQILLPNKAGTIALDSDIQALENKLPDTTKLVTLDGEQIITGAKTFEKLDVASSEDQAENFASIITYGSQTHNLIFRGTYGTSEDVSLKDLALKSTCVNLTDNQSIAGDKTFSGEVVFDNKITSNGKLEIAKDSKIIFLTDKGTVEFALPQTPSESNITITLPTSDKDLNDIGKGGSGNSSVLTSIKTYEASDTGWVVSTEAVDIALGKYYMDVVTLDTSAILIAVRTISRYGVDSSVVFTSVNDWPEVIMNNRTVTGDSGYKVRIYSNAQIAGSTRVTYILPVTE